MVQNSRITLDRPQCIAKCSKFKMASPLLKNSISLSHAMRPGLIRHFWVASRAGPENDNKFKERDLKINIESFANFFVVKKRVAKI